MLRSVAYAFILALSLTVMTAPSSNAVANDRLHEGEYGIVAARSTLTLTVSGAIGKISATMPLQGGRIVVDGQGQFSGAEAVVDASAAKAKNGFVETALRGKSGLNVTAFPTASFDSTSMRVNGTAVTISGNLTVRDVTRPIELTGEFVESAPRRFVLSMAGRITRTDFGITAGRPIYSRQADIKLRIIARR